MPLQGVMRLGYVHARVTDLTEAKSHYGNTLGLYPTYEEPGKIYYKGWDEWDHHSVVLEEGGVGLVKIGFKVSDPTCIDDIETKAQAFGCVTERMSKGETLEVSDGVRIVAPSTHVIEVYHGMTEIGTEVGTHNPEVFPRHLAGVGAPALDHALLVAEDVKTMDRFFGEVLGFYATERVVTSLEDDADYIATWMSAGQQVHDIAVLSGPNGKLHHFAFRLGDWNAILRAGAAVLHGRCLGRHRPDPARHHPGRDDLLLRPGRQPQRGVRGRVHRLSGSPDGLLDARGARQGDLLHPARAQRPVHHRDDLSEPRAGR